LGKVGKFYHSSTVALNVAAIGTSFDVAKFHLHNLNSMLPVPFNGGQFKGFIEGLYVRVTNIAGGSATPKITARLCCESGGDFTFLPDTEATLALGLTTATSGVCAYEFKLPLNQFFATDEVYLFIKIDQGTCTLANSCIVWSE
jgi:hypothetical protein